MCMRLVAVLVILGIVNSVSVRQSRGVVRRPSQQRLIRWTPQYTLRFQLVGYEDRIVVADEEPIDEILTELAVPITIGLPFKRSLRIGKRSFSVSGMVTKTEKRQLMIDVKCADLLESDDMVLDEHGRLVPAISGIKMHSSAIIKIGEEANLGGSNSGGEQWQPDGSIQRQMTKKRFWVRLEIYESNTNR